MPNWTTNLLCITGNAPSLRQCLNAIKSDLPLPFGQHISFHKILPVPPILQNSTFANGTGKQAVQFMEKGLYPAGDPKRQASIRPFTEEEQEAFDALGVEDVIDWQIKNWGCRGDACRTCLDGLIDERGEAYIRFETAWSPPTGILRALRVMFPDLGFNMRYRLEDDPEYPHDVDDF